MLINRSAKSVVTTLVETPSPKRLYFFDEIDAWQQDNHYIRSGYVKETNNFLECIDSLTYWHNESINVYSHLLPALSIFWALSGYLYFLLPRYKDSPEFWEILNFYQFGLAAACCLTLSASFHCFKCHSHKVSKIGNQCDYFGIVVLITCSLNSIVIFAFHDIPKWRNFYVFLFTILAALCTKLTFDEKFSTPAYRPFRSLMFIAFGLSGVLPVVTAIKYFGFSEAENRAKASWLVGEGFFYILGACLYAARVPERFTYVNDAATKELKPTIGKFDLIGHSHQIFHVMVVIAAYCHWKALLGCYVYMHENML